MKVEVKEATLTIEMYEVDAGALHEVLRRSEALMYYPSVIDLDNQLASLLKERLS